MTEHTGVEWGASIPDAGCEVRRRVGAGEYLARMADVEVVAVDGPQVSP